MKFSFTLRWSSLSYFRAHVRRSKYTPKTQPMAAITATFPVSWRRENSVTTLSKSMGFGATNNWPPKALKWLQEQWIESSPEVSATCRLSKSKCVNLTRKFGVFAYEIFFNEWLELGNLYYSYKLNCDHWLSVFVLNKKELSHILKKVVKMLKFDVLLTFYKFSFSVSNMNTVYLHKCPPNCWSTL